MQKFEDFKKDNSLTIININGVEAILFNHEFVNLEDGDVMGHAVTEDQYSACNGDLNISLDEFYLVSWAIKDGSAKTIDDMVDRNKFKLLLMPKA